MAGFANSVDPGEATHTESPRLDLLCLPFSLWILNITNLA